MRTPPSVAVIPPAAGRWERGPDHPARAAITPSKKSGGGSSDNPARCAQSGTICSQLGYRSWAISRTCQNRYPGGQFPIGCYY